MAADADSLSVKHSHSHHSLLRDMPDHSNSHSDNTVKEGNNPERMKIERKENSRATHPQPPTPHTTKISQTSTNRHDNKHQTFQQESRNSPE